MPLKSKIEKYSYLPRINLCELVMKLNNDCQCSVNLFTIYCAELNNDLHCRSVASICAHTPVRTAEIWKKDFF